MDVEAGLGEGGLGFGAEVAAGVDLADARHVAVVREDIVGTEEAAGDFAGGGDGAAVAAEVADGEGGEHLLKDVVEVGAGGDGGDVGLELALGGNGIGTVEVGVVEVGAFDAPDLVEHLTPLGSGIDLDLDLSERDDAFGGFDGGVGGNDVVDGRGWGDAGGGRRAGVGEGEEELFAVGGELGDVHVFG